MPPMGIVLRLELSGGHPRRVRVEREGDGVDYGWVRLDELPHLIAALVPPERELTDPLIE